MGAGVGYCPGALAFGDALIEHMAVLGALVGRLCAAAGNLGALDSLKREMANVGMAEPLVAIMDAEVRRDNSVTSVALPWGRQVWRMGRAARRCGFL